MNYNLLPVNNADPKHIEFLYDLLKERPTEANISHRALPTLEEHQKFVSSAPYQYWYILASDDGLIASVYLTRHDEIGVFVKKQYQKNGVGPRAVKMLMLMHKRKRYLANVAPENQPSHRLFTRLGAKLIQHTYELNESC